MQDGNDDCDDDENVDEPRRDMKGDEAECPENEQDDGNGK